ncbi:MAG: hypothetical protein H7832_09215, partial [Magnetococcus sp. DMHC-6]
MNDQHLLEPSCCVALAALLHDLGKFAQRAGLNIPNILEYKRNYCPTYGKRYSHIHAAFSAWAIQSIFDHLPNIHQEVLPSTPTRDNLLNIAAMHHKPTTSLERIIATGDRLSSGFDRTEFEEYNQAKELSIGGNRKNVNYLQARQWPILETIRINQTLDDLPQHRLPLKAMAPETIFPELTKIYNNKMAIDEYKNLWDEFVKCLKEIPPLHQTSLPLWLDNFDSLYLTFTHAIPSATATKIKTKFMTIPADVSLYDHSKATAALAVALWQYHNHYQTLEKSFTSRWHSDQSPDDKA